MTNQQSKVKITTDCVCDLPQKILQRFKIEMIHYNIHMGDYEYQSETEVTSANVLEYMEKYGQPAIVKAPKIEEYQNFFEGALEENRQLLHIVMDSKIGASYINAMTAADNYPMVTVYDSKQFSGGLGILILYAAEAAEQGKSVEEIIKRLQEIQSQTSTSFFVGKADCLYKNHRISKRIQKLCSIFPMHLVLRLDNGIVKISFLRMGKTEDCYRRYVKGALRNKRINKEVLMITLAGCSYEQQRMILEEIKKYTDFENIVVNTASAAVTCNCGTESIGLQFLNET